MQCEMLDLVGGSGEKPPSLAEERPLIWDEIEYDAEELNWFATASVRELANHWVWLAEVDYTCRNRRAQQLRQVMKDRGISLKQLNDVLLGRDEAARHG